jgi:hypothetical protein
MQPDREAVVHRCRSEPRWNHEGTTQPVHQEYHDSILRR